MESASSSTWYSSLGDVSDCSDVVVEELCGLEDFSDLEDDVFLPGDDWLPRPLNVDQYDADDEELATTSMMDQPLATLAMMMSPPASPTMTMDQTPPLAMMMPPPASPMPPIAIPTRSPMLAAGPIYSPITPSPPPIASPMSPSMLVGPPPYRPIYSPITPPMVPPMTPSHLGVMSSATAYTPTLSEVLAAVARLSPTMSQLMAVDAREGPPTLEMLWSMPQQTIAPRVGDYYSAITDEEEDGADTGM